jgi:primosomal protein N' (replication factor Y) (superfamily II helicase)
MKYAEIVVNVPTSPSPLFLKEGQGDVPVPYARLDQTFTYDVPPALRDVIRVGQMVWAPFGARRLQGLVVGLSAETAIGETRAIEAIVESRPLLSPAQIELARWMAHRYLAPLSECVWLMLPPGIEEKVETIYEISKDKSYEIPKAQAANSNGTDDGLTDKQRALLELVRERGQVKSTRIPPNVRSAVESLLARGYLTRRTHIKPAQAKPKRVTAVRLLADRQDAEQVLEQLGPRNVRAEIVTALAEANAPLGLDELCARVGCERASVQTLAKKGVVEVIPAQTAFSLTAKYFQELSALPPATARVLAFLRERGNRAPFDALYDATGATPSVLRALQERGLIEKTEQGEQVRLLSASPLVRPPSRLWQIVEFLEREGGRVWISAVYAATGANRQDLARLERAGLVELESEEFVRDPLEGKQFAPQTLVTLTTEQARAFAEIQHGLDSETACAYLLHGVTGSGKTEIYVRAIEQVLKQGKQAIALVPEIALTPQTIQRFGARFKRIGVIHSELSHGERYDTWRRARDGQLDVVIGPRSALFAPLPQLGLIVIDEEHDPSYKSDLEFRQPGYHTREVALELARSCRASVILGSATPDVETYFRARGGEFKLLELPQRILAHGAGDEWSKDSPNAGPGARDVPHALAPVRYQDLPPVQVVDLRAELREGNTSIFSRALSAAMQDALAAHAQVILFLNRRGTATSVLCRTCGYAVKCPRCNNPFTVHQFGNETTQELVCHHCGKRGKIPQVCPNCGSTRIRPLGLGTEKLEQQVRAQFPSARTLRWDWDMTRGKDAHERLLEAFTRGEADVLIGTQMIAKGLDLPRVTLVGVVNADTALNLPDFRASERTFQLLTQVAGRAGRSAAGGQVIIQTYYPEHYAIAAAARHDYASFYEQELRFRQQAAYPPFRPLVRLLLSSTREHAAREASERLASGLQDQIRRQGLLEVQVVGPAPAYFAKLGGRYRYQLLLRGRNARTLLTTFPLPLHCRVDVDPVNLL